MRTSLLLGFVVVSTAGAAWVVGCGSDGTDGAPGITDGNVNPVEGGNVVDAPPGCDPTKPPKISPACIDEGVGVFVDAASNATTPDGSRARPFKTINDAVAGNVAGRPRIYVCEGTYSENVVESNLDIYGGFTCPAGKWTYDGNKVGPTKVTGANDAATKFAALHLTAAKSVQIADIDFTEDNAPANSGGSSLGAWVEGAGSATFTNVALTAGTGADAPTPGAADDNSSNLADLSGNPGVAGTGGALKASTCKVFGTSAGGKGGIGGDPAGGGMLGASNPATVPSGINNGLGGQAYESAAGHTCANGNPGANGAPQAAIAGATSVGAVTASGWQPGLGGAGLAGGTGQGGGGGGGSVDAVPNPVGAGGGGAGGCGGGGGKPGLGGGASIGLLVNGSTSKLVDCMVQSSKAGQAAKGGTGGAGGGGGSGSPANASGCGGGFGGKGAGGGGGGGGAGGISVGVGYVGSAPTQEGTTAITVPQDAAPGSGSGGDPGAGGAATNGGNAGNPGVTGQNIATLALTAK